MKSCNTSLSPYRRALVAAAVVLATGSVAALAQTNSSSSNNAPSSGSNYESTQNNSASSNTSGTTGTMETDRSTSRTADRDTTATTDNDRSSSRSSSKLSWSDKHFITKAAEDNQNEIDAAQLAAEKATNPDVKSFAQHMVQEHTQVGQELAALASSKDVKIDQKKESHADKKLSKKTGEEFDRDFVKQMVSDHKKVIKEFKDRAEDAKDPELKQFAQKNLPNLEHHLQMAEQLEQSIVPTGRSSKDTYKSSSSSDRANTSSTSTNNSADNASATSNSSSTSSSPGFNSTTSGASSSTTSSSSR